MDVGTQFWTDVMSGACGESARGGAVRVQRFEQDRIERVLDWTESPLVGAYFAVDRMADRNGAVFVVDAPAIQERFYDRFQNPNADLRHLMPTLFTPEAPREVVFWSQTARRSARLVAQQGLFTLADNIVATHDRMFESIQTYAYRPVVPPAARWNILADAKDEILNRLRTANIAAHSLFPGLDGLGRSIAEVVRIGPRTTFVDTLRRTLHLNTPNTQIRNDWADGPPMPK